MLAVSPFDGKCKNRKTFLHFYIRQGMTCVHDCKTHTHARAHTHTRTHIHTNTHRDTDKPIGIGEILHICLKCSNRPNIISRRNHFQSLLSLNFKMATSMYGLWLFRIVLFQFKKKSNINSVQPFHDHKYASLVACGRYSRTASRKVVIF